MLDFVIIVTFYFKTRLYLVIMSGLLVHTCVRKDCHYKIAINQAISSSA